MTLPPCGKVPGLEALKDAKAAINAKLNLGKSALADLNSKLTAFKADVLAAVPKIPSLVSFQTELAGLIGANPSAIAEFVAKWQGKVANLNELVARVTGGIADIASLDFCKDIPNIKMDSSGNVVTEPPESKPVTESPEKPENITPTIVDNSTQPSTGESGLAYNELLIKVYQFYDAIDKEVRKPLEKIDKAAKKAFLTEWKGKKMKDILRRAEKHNKTVAECRDAGIEFTAEEIEYASSVRKLAKTGKDIYYGAIHAIAYGSSYSRIIQKTFGDKKAENDFLKENGDWKDNKTELGAIVEKYGFKSYFEKSISLVANYRTVLIDKAYYDQNVSK